MNEPVEILIAEDSPTQREHLRMILEDQGYSVRALPDGRAALDSVKERLPTLIVSDVNMPGLDGYGLCKAVKEDPHLKHLPVVLVTDLTGTHAIIRGLECGADNFFTKPYDEEHLVARLNYILANRRVRAQDNLQMGVEVTMGGRRHFITAERQQILDLLISSYEEAVHLSDRLRLQQIELQRAYQTTQALYRIADALNRCKSLMEVQERLLVQALELPGVKGGWLLLGNTPGAMRLSASYGAGVPAVPENGACPACDCQSRIAGADIALAGMIAQCGLLHAGATDVGDPRGHATIPLYVQGQLVGILNILGEDEKGFDAAGLDMLSALGSLAGTALDRAESRDQLEARVKARTAALLDSEERFRDYAEAASDWFWETDAEFRYTSFLERGTQTLGFGPNDLAGRSRLDMIPREIQVGAYDQHEADLRGHRSFRDNVIQWRRPNGEIVHVKANGKPIFAADGRFVGYRGTGRDITAEVQAAQALRESEERLVRLAENIPGVLFQRTEGADAGGKYPYISAHIKAILGCEPEHIQANPGILQDFLRPDFAQELFATLKRTAETASAAEIEGGAVSQSGEERWLRARFKFRQDASGDKVWDGLLLDVTEEHRLKLRQQTLEQQLRQSQKMEAIGNLTGGMAHDFNNILTIILGNLEGLVVSEELTAELKVMANEGIDACMRAAELTRQLLAFARRQPLEPKLFNPNDAVSAMAKLLGRTLGQDVEIIVDTAADLWQVLVDPAQLESAVANLSVNARDAMPGGGTITITTRNTTLDQDNVHFYPDADPGDYVCIEVADTGTGIPPEIMSRIFEPFFTTKEAGKGTGLGLAMIFGFAKQSGGYIQAYSEVGHGTSMRLYLPRSKEGDGAETTSERLDDAPRANAHELVLVVEDNEKIRRQVVSRLDSFGYKVREAASGSEALALIRRGEAVDLLFTDVVMPGGLNGYELYEQALLLRPGLRVLFTSGFSGPALGRAGALASHHALLTKPYRSQELARMVRQLLDKTPVAS